MKSGDVAAALLDKFFRDILVSLELQVASARAMWSPECHTSEIYMSTSSQS